MGFFLDGEVLYKKSKDQILLRCVDASEANKIVREIHEGVCGTHASGHVVTPRFGEVDIWQSPRALEWVPISQTPFKDS